MKKSPIVTMQEKVLLGDGTLTTKYLVKRDSNTGQFMDV